MTTTTYTISTAKGTNTGTLRAVCEWQTEMQGAFATISCGDIEIDVDGVDFDAEEIELAVAACEALLHRRALRVAAADAAAKLAAAANDAVRIAKAALADAEAASAWAYAAAALAEAQYAD